MKLLGQRDSCRLGFTLLETTIVMSLLGSLLLIGMYQFPSRQQQVNNEQLFWERLNTLWKQNIYMASSQQKARSVIFYTTDNQPQQIEFHRFNPQKPSEAIKTPVKLPPTLKFVQRPKIDGKYLNRIYISKTGHPSLTTFKIYSELTKKTVKITTQMGWGAYHVTIE